MEIGPPFHIDIEERDMAQEGNGIDASGVQLFAPRLTPSQTVPFEIGGETIRVPVLNLAVLKMCKESILSLGPGLDFISYAEAVVHIIHTALKAQIPNLATTEAAMLQLCSLREVRELPRQMNELLKASGFDDEPDPTEPAQPELPGIGTSTDSLQNSQQGESAEVISTGSSEPIPSSGVGKSAGFGSSIPQSTG